MKTIVILEIKSIGFHFPQNTYYFTTERKADEMAKKYRDQLLTS